MNKLVITRPQDQGQVFASQLVDSLVGLDDRNIILEPLLRIEHKHIHIEGADQYDGIIVTSSNALPSLIKNNIMNKPFYCVGEQTEEKLKQGGVKEVCACAYTASDLVKKIPYGKKRFLYLRGKDVSFDIKKHLQKRGIIVDEKVCYKAQAVDCFTQPFLNALIKNEIDLITFFSKRTADVFVRILLQWLEGNSQNSVDVRKIHILCIAQPVLECFHTAFNKEKIIVSKTPDMKGMLDAIDTHFSVN